MVLNIALDKAEFATSIKWKIVVWGKIALEHTFCIKRAGLDEFDSRFPVTFGSSRNKFEANFQELNI